MKFRLGYTALNGKMFFTGCLRMLKEYLNVQKILSYPYFLKKQNPFLLLKHPLSISNEISL